MTGQQSHGDWRPLVVPWHLVKRPSVDVAAQTCLRFWINVDIPAETPPGQYVAAAAIEGAGLPRKGFPVRLEVLPFKFDPLPSGVEQSMAMAWPHWWTQLDDRLSFFIRTYVIYSDPRKFKKPENAPFEPLYNEARKSLVERRKAELDLAHRYGLNLVYFATNYIDPPVIEELKSHYAGKRNIVWFKGEDPQDKTVAEMAARKAFLHCYGTPCLEDQTEAGVRKRGIETKLPVIVNMNTGTLGWSDVQQEAGIYRFEAGLLLWRLGAQGGIYGPWYMPWRDPYNPFDGHVSEWGDFCDPASTGNPPALNPTLMLEGLREGIQDFRYLAMLERLVREKPGTPAAQEGQNYLRTLREQIQPQASTYFQKIGRLGGWDNTWTQKETAWRGKDYREHRREITTRITALLRDQGR